VLGAQVLYSVEMGLLLLAACVLIGPIIAERLGIPGLVGLIAIGMALGPFVLEWLRPGGFVATVGAAGLLYLMFLAGVELDLKTFAANRTAAITFGLLTFVVPFSLSFVVAKLYLDFGTSAAALVGAMWASHTVVAYPEAKVAGLDRNRAVSSAVAATVITDVLALVVLAVAASSAAIEDEPTARSGATEGSALPLWAGLVLVTVFCLVVLPRLTRWVFAHLLYSRTQRFVWLLSGMAAGGIMGLLGGIEGLVGAFLAGIGMNSSVPAKSELMERVEFIGGALLVPAFLVSVGMSIDPRALVEPSTLIKAGVFTTLVVVGKTIPAVVSGRIFGFTRAESAIMAALTIGQAAATLAIAQVGVATGLFEQEILNAAVVTVVTTVLITSFGTRIAARSIERPSTDASVLGEHVVVHAPKLAAVDALAQFASAVARPDGGLVTPFVAAAIGAGAAGDRAERTARLAAFEQALTHLGHDTHAVNRVGASLAAATLSLVQECNASLVVVPIDSPSFPIDLTSGGDVDMIGANSPAPCVAVRLTGDAWKRIVVIVGRTQPGVGGDAGLALVAEIVARLRAERDVPTLVLAPDPADPSIAARFGGISPVGYTPGSGDVLEQLSAGDLVVVPSHVVQDAGVLARARLQKALVGTSVAVIGLPGALRVSMQRHHRPLLGMVGTPRES
jgi:Kef-type K+ transport system membrane component KefB